MVRKFSLLLLIVIFLINCGFITKSKNKKIKHPSEYRWTIDTLAVSVAFEPAFRPSDILYINKNDIYVFGGNAHWNDIYFHYDGEKWQDYESYASQSTYSAYFVNSVVFGVGEDYVGHGSNGLITSFKDNQWQRELKVDIEKSGFLASIAISEDDIWAGGYSGTLFHYNGSEWENFSLSDSIYIKDFSYNKNHGLYAKAISAFGRTDSTEELIECFILKFINQRWTIIDSFDAAKVDKNFHPFGSFNIYLTDNYIYTCGEGGVYRKKYNEKEHIKFDLSRIAYFTDVHGTDDDNIFAVGTSGTADHWDGENLIILDEIAFRNVIYTKCWTDGKQVYIIGYDLDKNCSYVIHGK